MLITVGILLPLAYEVLAGLYDASRMAMAIALAVMAATGTWTAVWMWRLARAGAALSVLASCS